MPFSPVDHGVTEEEPAKEPEDPYHEQEAAATDGMGRLRCGPDNGGIWLRPGQLGMLEPALPWW